MSNLIRVHRSDGLGGEVWLSPAHVVWVEPEDAADGPALVLTVSGISLTTQETVSELLERFSVVGGE